MVVEDGILMVMLELRHRRFVHTRLQCRAPASSSVTRPRGEKATMRRAPTIPTTIGSNNNSNRSNIQLTDTALAMGGLYTELWTYLPLSTITTVKV